VNAIEQALTFHYAGEDLVGIVSVPDRPHSIGVLIIVGGPQYRVGSHRQFVHLARRLAQNGFPAMRFDYRGMGDSSGTARSFDDVSDDIDAAIDAFQRVCLGVRKVVLWGLCDGASAALLHADTGRSTAVAGVIIANPWMRSDATLAKAQVKHYYTGRVIERQFWRKLIRGDVNVVNAARDLMETLRKASHATPLAGATRSFQQRMASGLSSFRGPVLVVLSGRDLTAREFEEYTHADPTWCKLLSRANIERCNIRDADHTFSSDRSRTDVENATVDWVNRLMRAIST
jgi:exosortase A-associated hydrolase 1